MTIINNLWKLLENKQKVLFLIIIFFSLIQAILEMIGIAAAIPFVTFLLKPESIAEIDIISKYIQPSQLIITDQLILIFCLIFFSIFLIKNFVIVITNKIIYNFIFTFRSKLFLDLLNNILHQEFLFFVKKGISKIFNTTFNEVDIFSTNIVRPLIILFSELLISFGIIFLIIITGNIDGLILIFPILVVVGLILKKINKSIKNWALTRIDNYEKIINYNFNLAQGIKEILILGKIKNIVEKFSNSIESLREVDAKQNVVTSYPKILLEQAVILIFILIILLMNFYGEENNDIIIILSFYLAAAYRLVPSINKIFVSYQQIKSGKPSISRVMEYYNLKKKSIFFDEKDSLKTLSFEKEIRLKNINFNYDNNSNVVENLDLEIKKNQIIGISGESGIGKSTIINILTTLLKVKKGEIFVDDIHVNSQADFRQYQNLFSISSQDTYLLDGTIKENIIFGHDNNFSKERFDEAIKFSRLENTINNLPNGVETFVGSTIKQISSGQKQRISIARSIYSDRKILIFDEATNGLDEENERIIFDNLKKLKSNKTIIIISHNPKNLDICDEVYQIKDKKLKAK